MIAKGKKAHPVDLSNMNRIFIGWVDVDPDAYNKMGYTTREEYEDVILHANMKFQETLKSKCAPGRTVVGAKRSLDENTTGNDLFIKFFDASYSEKYVLDLSVRFIDLKTDTELVAILVDHYAAGLCGLERCLEKELDQVNRELQKQLQCKVSGK